MSSESVSRTVMTRRQACSLAISWVVVEERRWNDKEREVGDHKHKAGLSLQHKTCVDWRRHGRHKQE